jgi:signal transduction histidine kinase
MFFTNLFLTRFVFKKIRQPLEMLSSGVNQISEGNLEHKIVYFENDEFKPVCEAFNDMAARLNTSVEEVKRNEQNRKELFEGISHDLRSPLTSIKAYVDGLLDGVAATPESQQEYLQIIKQKTDDINKMVSQLFLYSKLDMGNYPTHSEVLNIGNEIKEYVSASQEEYKTQGLIVEIVSTPANTHICADPVQLRSVFANILGNSAKYKVKETAEATINCTVNDGFIRIIFEDDGTGVPESELSKLFEVFHRSDPSRNNPHKGSGLGLAIASKTLERMNGRIYAENIDTGGLRMIVEIPVIKNGGQTE